MNKRIDTCINVLLRYARDKLFDRLQKVEKGKNTSRLQLISRRHKTSMDLSTDLVSIRKDATDKTVWKVMAANSSDVFQVEKENENCPYKCLLICRFCSVCVHQFSCTCLDSLTHGTIWKHVHLVKRFQNITNTFPEPVRISAVQKNGTQSQLLNLITTSQTIEGHTILRNRLLTKLSNLRSCVTETNDKESFIALNRQLDICLSLFGTARKPNKSDEPVNKHIKIQRSFYTTKRKRQTANIRIAKPSREQRSEITSHLMTVGQPKIVTVPDDCLRKQTVYVYSVHYTQC